MGLEWLMAHEWDSWCGEVEGKFALHKRWHADDEMQGAAAGPARSQR
jgi:hypothetical protein